MRLSDKVAIITGSANGIGLATAARFASEGCNVVICDINADEVASAEHQLSKLGFKVSSYVVDVCDRESIKAMVDSLLTIFGRIDILINNAGITNDASLLKMTEEQFDAVLSVNVKGVFNCTQLVAEHMALAGSGAIVNASSVSGVYGNFGQSNYAASKSALIGMGKTWARELGPKGIRVNTVVPGPVATDMLNAVPATVLDTLKNACWLRRIGKPEEIANAYLFLASDESSFVNGATLEVSGGVSI